MFDVIVIGAGPSGMMSAIMASKNKYKVLLIEKNNELGKKMRLTGGGRCNITNLKETNEFVKNLPVKNGRFLFSALNNFNPYDIYSYFENLNVKLKVEDNDRVFPESDQSSDLINALKTELENLNVEIKYGTEVLDLQINHEFKTIITNKGEFKSKNVVIATGGLSYPHTGSSGTGHQLAEKLTHSITELFPTESPLISSDPIIISKELQGISLNDIVISLVENNKIIKSHNGDLIFTHFGLSGPAALKLSQFVYHHLKEHKEANIQIDLLPNYTNEEIIKEIKEKRESSVQKQVKTVLRGYTRERLIEFILKQINIDQELKMNELANKQIDEFVNSLKRFTLKIHGVKPVSVAFVTGGGVSLKEINPQTLESKLIPGLYFVGEVLDLHGYTGGYNITIALSTGYTAGISIKEKNNE